MPNSLLDLYRKYNEENGIVDDTPDYFVEMLPTSPWIHQPFESYDAMRPEQLIQKWSV